MPAQLEVILVDTGESAEQVVDRANSAPEQMPGRKVTDGEASPADGGDSAGKVGAQQSIGAIVTSLGGLGRAVGAPGSGLIGTVHGLTRALADLHGKTLAAAGGSAKAAPAGGARADAIRGSRATEAKGPEVAQPQATEQAGVSVRETANVVFKEVEPVAPPIARPSASSLVAPTMPRVPAGPPATSVGSGATALASRGATALSASSLSGPAAGLAAGLGPAAVGIAAVGAAAIGAAAGVKVFSDTMRSQAEKLEGYSAELSNQAALTDLRAEMADMRRADTIGPQLAQFENDRSRAMTAISDIGTSILKVLLDFYQTFQPAIEMGLKSLELIAAGGETISAQVASYIEYWNDNQRAADLHWERAMKAADKMYKLLTDEREVEPLDDPFLQQFLGGADGRALQQGIFQQLPARGAPAPLGV